MLLGRILATNIDILMPRVEELLAGGDADVEDLDTDGESFIECFSYFFFFFLLGATPIILAAIGGHLPLVQVSLQMIIRSLRAYRAITSTFWLCILRLGIIN